MNKSYSTFLSNEFSLMLKMLGSGFNRAYNMLLEILQALWLVLYSLGIIICLSDLLPSISVGVYPL